MNKFSSFLMGLLVGVIGVYFFKSPQKSILQAQNTSVAEPCEVSAVAPTNPSEAKRQEPQASLATQVDPQVQIAKPDTQQLNSLPVERKPAKIEVTLSERDVKVLESQWSDLPHQAEVVQEVRGWRIKMIQPNTVLFNAGLREGNLITKDFLHQFAQEEGDEKLAGRVANILNHISIR